MSCALLVRLVYCSSDRNNFRGTSAPIIHDSLEPLPQVSYSHGGTILSSTPPRWKCHKRAIHLLYIKAGSISRLLPLARYSDVYSAPPVMHDAEKFAGSTSGESLTEEELILAQIAREKGREVQYRTCSWQKVQNSLLFSVSLTNFFRPLLFCFQNTSASRFYRFPG